MLIGEWGSFKAIHRICKERTQTNTFIRIIYSPRGKRYLMVFYLLVIIFIIFIVDMYFPIYLISGEGENQYQLNQTGKYMSTIKIINMITKR